MSTVVLAIFIKPLVALILFGIICLPARILVQKMREGKLKRLLLFRISDSPGGGKTRQ
jgi:hypothetical protein